MHFFLHILHFEDLLLLPCQSTCGCFPAGQYLLHFSLYCRMQLQAHKVHYTCRCCPRPLLKGQVESASKSPFFHQPSGLP